MKRIIAFILTAALCMTFFSGCSVYDSMRNRSEFSQKNKEIENIIIDCINGELEPAELSSLFCRRVSDKHDIEQEISGAIEFVDGNLIADGIRWSNSGGQESVNDGKTDLYESWIHTLDPIKTDTGKDYDISFSMCHIDLENEDLVGLSYINISLDDSDESFKIGGTR